MKFRLMSAVEANGRARELPRAAAGQLAALKTSGPPSHWKRAVLQPAAPSLGIQGEDSTTCGLGIRTYDIDRLSRLI